MSSTITSGLDEPQEPEDGSAGVARSEPPRGRAQRRAGGARRRGPRPELADGVKALLPDELLAGAGTGEEIDGPGGLLGRSRSGWWSGRWRSS